MSHVLPAAGVRPGSPFLTTEQAAFYLGLSARTLERHRGAGVGPAFRRHRGLVRYHIEDLEGWSETLDGACHG